MKLGRTVLIVAVAIAFGGIIRGAYGDDYSVLGANVQNYVTGTMEGNYAWYEQGFDPDAPASGLPPAGIIQSQSNPNWSFRLQPYNQNNVMLLGANNDTATMTFTSPVTANAIAIASATAIGPALLSPTIHFADGTPDYIPSLLTEPDWFYSTGPILANGDGRIQIFPTDFNGMQWNAGRFDNVGGTIPIRIDTLTLPSSLASHPISSITMNWSLETTSPDYTSHTAIFAISTSTDGGTTFVPGNLTAPSFNTDVVVEAAALPEPTVLLLIPGLAVMIRRRAYIM
jgi:hypothetical protein